MVKLTIANLHGKIKLNRAFLASAAREIARRLGIKKGAFAVVFTGAAYIKRLNRDFKKRDCPTDVLSFDVRPPEGGGVFGDIFISLDAAVENACRFGSYFEKEVVLYMIHGMLHLTGYDDASPRRRARMRRKETELLDGICKTRKLSKVSTSR